ncbi:xylulokinase [Chelatococcus sp. SYSU_G07232]|uniref:Xylulose kinase n=1 Tax=Chelatococcus albus TaxID=3047466 RepID=A0ABT7AGP5_9HYPH|nr:xylulokinase [Chelatococcus sp. SYSU_G07232]MDJ1158539.1 xylulokinase [Chelatococcus sp. SYSU_G07232]
MFLGIDIGTSSVKVVLVDEDERIVASASEPLALSRPRPGFSEQDPENWWRAVLAAVDAVRAGAPQATGAVRGIGLSGQMHGAVLLDAAHAVLRPCILWNDGRAVAECAELEAAWPDLRRITGNPAMPGFTAPKLAWVRRHEPEIFARTALVLLPKAYVRLRLTGEAVEEMSDGAGTLWLDPARREWSEAALAATGLTRGHMPRLVEGNAPAGRLRPELAARWGMAAAPVVAGGAGDNAAGAVGLGAVEPGSAFLSLGTSGVLWATTERFAPNPAAAVHAFCHALPERWHQMGVILSAASCLAWWAGVAGQPEAKLLAALGDRPAAPSPVLFLPYLSGERTPHNDAALRGVFAGLAHETDREVMTQAVLEGVGFAFRDCLDALAAAGTRITAADVIGGGSRSGYWVTVLAAILGLPLHRLADGEAGAALGAARLGRMAVTGETPEAVCRPPRRLETVEPDAALAAAYAERHARYRALYPAVTAGLA